MSKWKKVRIEDVCDILDAYRIPITAKDREKGIYPYYGANGIQDYVKNYIFDGDYILIAEDGGHFGSKTKPISFRVSGKFWVNNHAHILKAQEKIDTDYLYYATMFYDVSNIINGATRQKLTQSALRKMEISLPAMEEQRKIAQRLDAVSDLLAKQKQLLAEQDTLIQSLFYDMFGDPIKNNKGWKIDELQNVATSRLGKMLDAKKQTGKNNRFYLANQNVKWFDFDFKDLRKMDFNEEDQKEFKLENGDVLVCEGGDVGRSAIWKSNLKECYFQKALHRIRCNLKKIVPIFLVRLFYTISLHNGFDKIVGNKATIAHLTGVKLKTLKIPVPPLELQEKFAAIVEQIESERSKIKSAIAETQTLFNALMAEYFEE